MKLKALEGKLKKKKAVANFSQMEQLLQPFQQNRANFNLIEQYEIIST